MNNYAKEIKERCCAICHKAIEAAKRVDMVDLNGKEICYCVSCYFEELKKPI